MATVNDLIERLQQQPNILLYGPPGTGKSTLMRDLQQELKTTAETTSGDRSPGTKFDTDEVDDPFMTPTEGEDEPEEDTERFPGEVKTAWLTFHESTSYEDFIIGLRPVPEESGVRLQPRAGTLLSLAEHAREGNTSVLFIDEINRANVSKVFGQFISLMEADKRLASDGTPTRRTLEVTFSQTNDGESVENPLGEDFEIDQPYRLPKHLYIVASMNSLDRSTEPLDSALMRRFEQINLKPEYGVFAEHLDSSFAPGEGELDADFESASIGDISLALLWRVNQFMRSALGDDFQLGPGYLWEVSEVDDEYQLEALSIAWDRKVMPKLQELFRARNDQLATLLRVDQELNGVSNPYQRLEISQEWADVGLEDPIDFPAISNYPDQDQRAILHGLARQ